MDREKRLKNFYDFMQSSIPSDEVSETFGAPHELLIDECGIPYTKSQTDGRSGTNSVEQFTLAPFLARNRHLFDAETIELLEKFIAAWELQSKL